MNLTMILAYIGAGAFAYLVIKLIDWIEGK